MIQIGNWKLDLLALNPKNYSFWRRIMQIGSLLVLITFPIFGIFRIDIANAAIVIMGKQYWWNEVFVTYMVWLFLVSLYYFIGMVFGRIFCGWSCPQNLWAEVADFFLFKIFGFGSIREKKSKVFTRKPSEGTEKILYMASTGLLLTIVGVLTWLVVGSYFLPFSQMLHLLTHPNIVVVTLWIVSIGTMGFFFAFGHWYCKIVCPVGMIPFLTWSQKTMSLQFDKTREKECVNCNLCFASCVTQINVKDAAGDSKRFCINCGVCADVCAKKMGEEHNQKGSLLQITPGKEKSWPAPILLAAFAVVVSLSLVLYGLTIHNDINVSLTGKNTLGKAFNMTTNTANFTVIAANKDNKPHSFNIKVTGLPEGSYTLDKTELSKLAAGTKEPIGLTVNLNNPDIKKGTTEMRVELIATDANLHATDSVKLFKPDIVNKKVK